MKALVIIFIGDIMARIATHSRIAAKQITAVAGFAVIEVIFPRLTMLILVSPSARMCYAVAICRDRVARVATHSRITAEQITAVTRLAVS